MASKMVLLFYKGTSLPYDTEFYDKVLPNASEMIRNGLKAGESRKTQIQDYIEQLDFLEQSIVNCKTPYYSNREIEVLWGDQYEQYVSIWFLNILALLELGGLKNDNMNGTMFLGGNLPLFENKCLWCEKPIQKSIARATRKSDTAMRNVKKWVGNPTRHFTRKKCSKIKNSQK